MSAETGSTLVRSPPNVLESRVRDSAQWSATHSTYNAKIQPQVLPAPTANGRATVKKVTTQGAYSNGSGSSAISLENGSIDSLNKNGNSTTFSCDCHGRVDQLKYDLKYLQNIHADVLEGLHRQIEELKKKNKDLTFELIIERSNTSAKTDVQNKVTEKGPGSTQVKVNLEDQNGRLHNIQNGVEVKHSANNTGKNCREIQQTEDPASIKDEGLTKRGEHQNGSPHIDIKKIKKEFKELKLQLDKEKSKNIFLEQLVENLKREIRDKQFHSSERQRRKNESKSECFEDAKVNSTDLKLPRIADEVDRPSASQLHAMGMKGDTTAPEHKREGEKKLSLPFLVQSFETLEKSVNRNQKLYSDYGKMSKENSQDMNKSSKTENILDRYSKQIVPNYVPAYQTLGDGFHVSLSAKESNDPTLSAHDKRQRKSHNEYTQVHCSCENKRKDSKSKYVSHISSSDKRTVAQTERSRTLSIGRDIPLNDYAFEAMKRRSHTSPSSSRARSSSWKDSAENPSNSCNQDSSYKSQSSSNENSSSHSLEKEKKSDSKSRRKHEKHNHKK